jgi:hypothetical protein
MTPQTRQRHVPSYSPNSDRYPPRWWHHVLKPSEILSVIALIAALIAVLGWRFQSPAASIAAVEVRATRLEYRVDTLFEQGRLTNYMQCVTLRLDHPELLPRDCMPIIESRRPRQ